LRLAKNLIEKDESWNKVRIDQNKKEEEEQGMGENEFPVVGHVK